MSLITQSDSPQLVAPSRGVFAAATIAELKTFTSPVSNQTVEVDGSVTRGDGLGGTYFWNATDVRADNGTTIIASNLGGIGRWNMLDSDVLPPFTFPIAATNVGFTPSGTGAVTRTVQSKLSDILALADYDTLGHYNTAVAALPNAGIYTFGGLLNARGLSSLVNGNGDIFYGINTQTPTGIFEIGGNTLAALKIVGLSGQADDVELAMVQDQGGLRTYGGFFLVRNTTSDLTWTRRVNLNDIEVFRVANSTGNIGINIATATGFKIALARTSNVDFSEFGFYSQSGVVVAGLGVDGVSSNDLRIASIANIGFYAGSTIAAGSTPTNLIFKVTSTVVQFGTNTAKGAEAFSSFITINDAGGTPRKVMVCA